MPNTKSIERRLTFSQRHGYEDLPEPMRREQISDELRRKIWNKTRRSLDGLPQSIYGRFDESGAVFIEEILGDHLAVPEDDVPKKTIEAMSVFKNLIIDHEQPFNRLLDLMEAMLNHPMIARTRQVNEIRRLFENHAAPYRLSHSRPFYFIPRSTDEQGNTVAESALRLRKSGMDGASTHLRQAAVHLRDQRYAESITASVHAVESVARLLAPDAIRTLSPALTSLEKSGLLKHKALKKAMLSLYGYTCDEQGLRHALVDRPEADVGEDEALFMYGACACFAAYLADKHRKV